jgi:endonuclease III related protein
MTRQQRLLDIFKALLQTFGKRHWWPGDTRIEVIVGAILTQNTSWKNVEKAIHQMKEKGILEIGRLYEIDSSDLGSIIRSSGFYNIKARRLKEFVAFLHDEYGGHIENLLPVELHALRKALLGISGIGEETADSILLYALDKPVFVVDAYTKRFLRNHLPYPGNPSYSEVQRFFMDSLPADTYLFNEFHALIVRLAQLYCRKVPQCTGCPLEHDLVS